MRIFAYRPGSFPRLVWIGFFCVTLPLVFALANAGLFAGRFAGEAGAALQRTARAASDSRLLHDQLVSIERRARQLHVLGEAQLLAEYEERRLGFRATVARLRSIFDDPPQAGRLDEMIRLEAAVHAYLSAGPQEQGADAEALDQFVRLNELSREVLEEAYRRSLQEADALQASAAEVRWELWAQASAVVPLTILASALFAALLARPVRQIDRAIQGLGAGDFGAEIRVRGPRDLEFLGERLDWLRLRLVELEQEKTRFLAHVSHDLKTPLAAIREGAELLQEGVVGRLTPEQREISTILKENAVKLQRMIENLLRFSVGTARAVAATGRIDLAGVAQAVLADHRPALLTRFVQVHATLPATWVAADHERVRVVLDNLVSNAVRFTPSGGAIGVRLVPGETVAVVEVWDTGPGIPPEERGRIFEPFYQGGAPGGGAVKGSGLGLAIVAEYLEQLGGSVVVGEALGGGALFRVTLPAAGEKESS